MQSLADGLPPEVARLIHPNWRKNEIEYWNRRDVLSPQYCNQWIAFADGTVLVAGSSPVEIYHAAQQSGKHPYVTCVGHEIEPCMMRRTAFTYDDKYPGEALPLIAVEFRTDATQPGMVLDRVIPDTGADASALPWADCRQLQLDPATGVPGLMGGVGQSAAPTIAFSLWAYLDGQNYLCRIQADFSGNERILGRDVLNKVDILFRGRTGEIVINP